MAYGAIMVPFSSLAAYNASFNLRGVGMSIALHEAKQQLALAHAEMKKAKAALADAKAIYDAAREEQDEVDERVRLANEIKQAIKDAGRPWAAAARQSSSPRAMPTGAAAGSASKFTETSRLAKALWGCGSDSEAVGLLAESSVSGANLDNQDQHGQTCLINCAMRGYPEACLQLVQMGANPNAKSSLGEGPLALAAIGEHLSTFKALLSAGADPCEIDNDGNGIIHKIIDSESRESKTMLILAINGGADPGLKNRRGLTPLRMMENMGISKTDPRHESFLHLMALAEAFAIEKSSPAIAETQRPRSRL